MNRIYALAVVTALAILPGISSAQTTNTYTYDDLGRVTSVSYPSGAKTAYTYDAADNRTVAQSSPNGVFNTPLSCHSQYFTITNIPPQAPPLSVAGPTAPGVVCSDPNGYTLTTTSPTTAPTFTLVQGQSYSYTISVIDTAGLTGSGLVTFHRQ